MGNIARASIILLFLVLAEFTAAYFENQSTESNFNNGCNSEGECDGTATSLLSAAGEVSIHGFSGAPDIVNAFWVLIAGFLLTLAIALFIVGIAGALAGNA